MIKVSIKDKQNKETHSASFETFADANEWIWAQSTTQPWITGFQLKGSSDV